MPHTIFILGTDPQQCKELREILQERIADKAITTHHEGNLPAISRSDTVIIVADEKGTGVLYHRLLNKLEEQVHRAELLGELIRLFSSNPNINELLEQVLSKSDMLGDTSLIVLASDAGELTLEAIYDKNRERLVRMLVSTINMAPQGLHSELIAGVMDGKQPIVVPNLRHANLSPQLRTFVDKYSLTSLLAVPIQTKEAVLGAFVSFAAEATVFTSEDVRTAATVADFTAIALENAGLFSELQRSAITDSLTGIYNTRFLNEVLQRETARADRYTTPLALLMIDVDTFKLVNDTFGHVVGNKVLTQIAKILERTVRNTDFVFRCGGDEFGVVLPGTNLDGALLTAQKIVDRVISANILTGLGYTGHNITVSIGVSEYRRGSQFETLVAEADQALYASKRSSGNCARAFSASSGEKP